ncbi:MAG: DNA/RNA non-specific endonuclease [Bacteroidia bacterium]|nr:DNA/RNA non-specific endonuclease [Bacteroidia bacterium]
MSHTFRSILILLFFSTSLQAQNLDQEIRTYENELFQIENRKKELGLKLEALKLKRIQKDLHELGNPALKDGEELIVHQAFSLVYSEEHEQAKWVAHILLPDVIKGNVPRSNDFREDPKVKTGTAVEKDYFLKYPKGDGEFEYDGFGYDRGHLAPSADFRWSEIALSESYFYSNMSPQVPEFNRGTWAELESIIRGYMYKHPKTQLYIVSGPVLTPGLPKIERSINKLSIPKFYFKVVLDLDNQKAIGFLMPNKEIDKPIETMAVPIDQIEKITGLDFFASLPDNLESTLEAQDRAKDWLPDSQQDDVLPLDAESLPPHHFNTLTAKNFAEYGDPTKINICGTVVSTKLTSNGHIFLNLDKKFPKQIFTATIWKDNRVNFSYEPHLELEGKCICVEGTVRLSRGTPTMELKGEENVKFWQER